MRAPAIKPSQRVAERKRRPVCNVMSAVIGRGIRHDDMGVEQLDEWLLRFDPRAPAPDWIKRIVVAAESFLSDPGRPGAAQLELCVRHCRLALRCMEQGEAVGAATMAAAAVQAAWMAEMTEARELWYDSAIQPEVNIAERFRKGQAQRSTKLDDVTKERVRRRYLAFCQTGEKHGAIGRLAKTFKVSTKTISAILKE